MNHNHRKHHHNHNHSYHYPHLGWPPDSRQGAKAPAVSAMPGGGENLPNSDSDSEELDGDAWHANNDRTPQSNTAAMAHYHHHHPWRSWGASSAPPPPRWPGPKPLVSQMSTRREFRHACATTTTCRKQGAQPAPPTMLSTGANAPAPCTSVWHQN